MRNLLKFQKSSLVQVLIIYLLWQVGSLALYRILYRIVPNIFSPGPIAFLLPQIVPVIAALTAFWIMIRFINRSTFVSFGFTTQGSIVGIAVGLLLGLLTYTVYVTISFIGGWYHITGINHQYYFRFALLYCFLLAVAEETIFRGYIFQTLEKHWDTKIALLGSSFGSGIVATGKRRS